MSSPGTPGSRRSTRSTSKRDRSSEADTPSSRRSRRGNRSADSSPPSQRRRTDEEHNAPVGNSESDLFATSPAPPSRENGATTAATTTTTTGKQQDASLISTSPGPPQMLGTSEIDMSSPLHYGTPSSRASGTPRSHGTPARQRVDIGGAPSKPREVNLASESGNETADGVVTSVSDTAQGTVIWGTDIIMTECRQKFKHFLLSFRNPDVDPVVDGYSPDEPFYLQKLEEINVLELPILDVDCMHIKTFNKKLYEQLLSYPQEVIPSFDFAARDVFQAKFPDTVLPHQVEVRTFNVEKTKNMRMLNPEDIDQLITVSGMVIRLSNLVPEMVEAFFRCYVCHFSAASIVDRGRIAEPTVCRNCSTKFSMTLIHNRSQFSDKQVIKLQESPDDMPPGQTPHTVLLIAHGDLVDAVSPGDRITVTGIYRATPLRVTNAQRNVKSVYRTHIDVIHFKKTDAGKLHCSSGDDVIHKFTEERIKVLQELSKSPDIYSRLARALAPSIYEHDDIKKGILCQLFGGTRKDFSRAGRGHFRAEMNILLCGDPGTSKSQLLQYVYNLLPRGQYTSGKGSSAVGLTAYITKDPETGQLVLQTGALVLSDNGICCIDEFDKMNESTRSILHEVMEQQTLSIAKAGIICSLNARTSILAAANPVESQWNPKKTTVENIQLPHTLMSRFDLIFLMLDPQDEMFDRRLATHLVSLYHHGQQEADVENIGLDLLRDYIAYAKNYINPVICEEAGQTLIEAYVEMRKIGSGRGQVSAYPRQLESLIRLSESHAKMRLSKVVENMDVEEAKRLHREALKQSAVDPSSGIIDINIITTGMSETARKRRAELAAGLRKHLRERKQPTFRYQLVLDEMREQTQQVITREMFDGALRDLQEDDFLVVANRTIRLVSV